MDDMFDMTSELPDFCGDEDGGMLSEFDTGLEPQMRSRAYTWPTRPVAQIVDEQSNASSAASPGVIALAAPHLLSGDDGERGSHGELQLSPGGGVASSRKASSRRNAWGNLSYADLITKAIESSPDKRLTLSQIYAWMVANVPFFSDKGDSNSSAGWKNSIRHNLSLHSRFVRVQNEGTGKSSWWMVNPDAVSKMPRKRAGTMDSTVCRRPTRPKRPSGGLKHTRSTELHAASSGNDLFDPNAAARSPSVVANDLTGFESPRVRANSGNSSTGGCSPATLEPSDIKPSCYTMPPSAWDALYPPKQETLSESLADIFISDATGGGGSESPSTQMYGSVPHGMQPMFMANEAYAHGVPIHQPSPQHFLPPTQSPNLSCKVAASAAGYGVSTTSGFQTNGGQMFGVNGGGSATERVPTLGELLQDQSTGSGYLLNTFLTSGGTVTSAQQQQQQPGWSGGEFCATQPSPGAGAQSLRRPLHINQRVLMQLLATKPHLARRLQQLIEAKRRQLSAMQQQQQQQDPIYPPQMMSPPGLTAGGTTSTTMLQQLLTGGDPGLFSPTSQFPDQTAEDDSGFPKDLDISLQDLQSTSDMSCDIEQVIRHELSFGDKLDFSFDQLHLDEFEPDFAS